MASQCKRQQCTIDRLGFRQELDSWRHKLIHCVGFESILEGLFGPEVVEDLKLFKDIEPVAVSDWSFDENCLFCCLRRDKVKEHLIGLSNEGLENTPRPLQSTISRLEKQAEEFLSAVLSRKDVPNFSDPHIPIVAREILQRMIRQFAAEYTSKTSSPQDSCSESQACSDQSLPTAPLEATASPSTSPAATLAGPAHNQNPVLSKLLMADQDAPLDLTIKKPLAERSEQDGVLDLSIKKNRCSSTQPVHSSCLSPATSMLKGESTDLHVAKAKDLQSTSTLEQFMAKLCPHHQRQIVDAIGFLQTEVKALASSSTHQASNSTSGIQGTAYSASKLLPVTPEKSCPELSFSSESTPKSEVQDSSSSSLSSCAMEGDPGNAVSLKTSVTDRSAMDLRSLGLVSNLALVTQTSNPVDTESNHHGNHAPLKMKIMTSNVADGKKLSCVLNASVSTHSDTLENRQVNSVSSNKAETYGARLSSSAKRNNQTSHPYQARQKEAIGQAKNTPAKMISVHMTIPSDSPRTARKTFRSSSDHRNRDSTCKGMADPDLGHCDIVFIDKPITECFKEQQRSFLPRRNARKSTRGHMYSDEIWELKTVRTLAGRGNCPNPMPELITLVTPKQILSKPEGVPPVDRPFVGPCRETMNQQMPTEELDEMIIPGSGDMVEVAVSEVDVIVETTQTDQFENKGQSPPPSPISSPTENKQEDLNIDVEQDTSADSGTTAESEESAGQASFNAEKNNKPDFQEDICKCTEQIESDTAVEPENITREEAESQLSENTLYNNEPLLHEIRAPSPPSLVIQVDREREKEEMHDEEPQKLQPEPQIHYYAEMRERLNTTGSADKPVVKEAEIKTSDVIVDSVTPLGTDDNDSDVSSKTLDALLKELPPWRRKRGTVISPPKHSRLIETVIVGYVNGRPISASDRSLRRRSSNSITSPIKNTGSSSQNVPNKTSSDSTIHSNVENKGLEQPLSETHKPVKLIKTAPIIDHMAEPSSDTPSTATSKFLSTTKQIQKQKRVQRDKESVLVLCDQPADRPQSTESTRQLRSTSQKHGGSLVSSPTVRAVSPKPAATHTLQSTEPLPILPLLPPLPDTCPLTMPATTAASEQSQQNIVTESSVELSIEKPQLEEATSKAKEVECRMQARQKLRSAKVIDDSKNENWELIVEGSSPVESQSPVKTDMQAQIPLRNKRLVSKEAETSDVPLPVKPNVAYLEGSLASGDDSSCSMSDKPTRMPLRSESSKAETLHLSVPQSPQVENKKVALRSPRLIAPSTSALSVTGRQTDTASPIRIMPERITKAQGKPCPLSVTSVLPQSSVMPVIGPRPEPPKQTANKFLETLTGEENQHLITNLNMKYDKMQKGWVQMDKEGQPGTKYKSKADRQAAIWKSKRRARKPKSSEHQKYSPVQMLFMKGFNLTSICRWFLESTETKSLVIVKKVNTRLPSETQLCFHSSSSASGNSQGVFPSLQAERLKKHLKKFAIASPVKSNPRSQKLIAKALQQEANTVKGKERRELPSTTHTLSKSHSSVHACKQRGESQKSSGKSKNPASARILRKYSNIREKLQVHQTSVRLKKVSKSIKSKNMGRLTTTKSTARSSLKTGKSALPVSKQMKGCAAKLERRKAMAGRKNTKRPVHVKGVKAQSSARASRDTAKKELPKRWSQRLGSLKISDHHPAHTSKSNVDKKTFEVQKVEVEKPSVSKMNAAKIQTKESSQSSLADNKGTENAVETPQQSVDVKVQTSPDQVLTRSQRKMEMNGNPCHASKRAKKSATTKSPSPKLVRKAEEPTLTRSGALKTSLKRSQAALLPRIATKLSAKRAQESLETPAKRTRTSFAK